MTKVPKKHTPEFKFNMAVESLKGEQTITQLASENGVHPKQIQRWRDQLLSEGQDLFIHKATQRMHDPDRESLMHIINQLSSELDFLKKKLGKRL
jgi:transposase-like protein